MLDRLIRLTRSLRKIVKPGADKVFLRDCLGQKREQIAPTGQFHFSATSKSNILSMLVVQ